MSACIFRDAGDGHWTLALRHPTDCILLASLQNCYSAERGRSGRIVSGPHPSRATVNHRDRLRSCRAIPTTGGDHEDARNSLGVGATNNS